MVIAVTLALFTETLFFDQDALRGVSHRVQTLCVTFKLGERYLIRSASIDRTDLEIWELVDVVGGPWVVRLIRRCQGLSEVPFSRWDKR